MGTLRADPWDRFIKRVDVQDAVACWNWMSDLFHDGYGQFITYGDRVRAVRAHRYAYEHYVGPIPEGLVIDHLCRNRRCVNPAHLEPVTQRENLRRGQGLIAENIAKVLCKRGHPFDGVSKRGSRTCKQCNTILARGYRAAKKTMPTGKEQAS